MALTKIRQEQGVVINEGSTDVDFRVESNAGTHALFVDGATNAVSFKGDGTNQIINSPVPSKGAWTQYYKDMTPSFVGGIGTYSPQADASVSGLVFSTYSGSWLERMRIDSSGNLLVGQSSSTAPASGNVIGAAISPLGYISTNRTSVAAEFGTQGNGDIAVFRNGGTAVGSIGSLSDAYLYIGSTGGTDTFASFHNGGFRPATSTGADNDNALELGGASGRWAEIYAANATINTSDRNEKQDIASLTPTEMLVAARLSTGFKNFKWKDAVAKKGAAARMHSGIIAQDVQAAFTSEGLDAGDYSMFISSTWWEHDVDVAAVEADDTVEPAIEAADAYTRTDTYDTEAEAPEGATSKTRMGIRYPELLAFVAAYNEQRFASIEARITALE